jgi:DNA-binding NarL/FixJ family response regulator
MEIVDAIRIGVDAAQQVVRGHDYAVELTERVYRLFGADGGAGLTRWRVAEERVTGLEMMVLSAMGAAQLTPTQVRAAEVAVPDHPAFPMMLQGRWVQRLSDVVDLPRFWDTEVYHALHGHSDGRFPAAVVLGRSEASLLFLGIHRHARDLDDDEMACLVALTEPLRAALAFRQALDAATRRLGTLPGAPFTAGEAEVIVLVSKGWTTDRIARRLRVSQTVVKRRLASARDRVGAVSRSELVAYWAQHDR